MRAICVLLWMILNISDRVNGQTCQGASQYDQCSANVACGCLPLTATDNDGICAYLYLTCSKLISCDGNNRTCYQPDHVCVKHSRCNSHHSLCYPINMATQAICPRLPPLTTMSPIPHDGICANATWNKNGTTVAGGNGQGPGLDQLYQPSGLFVDDDGVIYVADGMNNRVVKWRPGDLSGQIVAGGNGEGNHSDQLDDASSVVVDKNGTMFICDSRNARVQRWVKGENQAQTIIPNILCWGLAMDNEGSLYFSDAHEHAVKKWPSDQIVAGGNGEGPALNQLQVSAHIFVDRDKSVFVADTGNNRVIKWVVGAKEGIVVAGGNGKGDQLDQLGDPQSMIIDQMGTIYVADWDNRRIMRWFKGSKSGIIIVDDQSEADPLELPIDLTFDRHGNLYVVDYFNHRVKMYAIDKTFCSADTF